MTELHSKGATMINLDGESALIVKVNPEPGTKVTALFQDKGIKLSFLRKLTILTAAKKRRKKGKVAHA